MSFTFAVLTDTHLGKSDPGGVHNPASGAEVADRLRRLGPALADCDFALHLGDVIDDGRRETIRQAAEIFRGWPCPVRICLGNHDAMTPGGRGDWLDEYLEGFGDGRQWYAFGHGGWRFVVLDAWWLDGEGGLRDHWTWDWGCVWQVPPEQLDWLDRKLSEHAGAPTVLCLHPLALPLTARVTGTADAHHPPRPESVEELWAVLARHPQVVLQLGGHAHAHQVEPLRGILQVATAAACEYPCEYRRVRVAGERLEITTHAWPGEAPMAAEREWVAGQAADRELRTAAPRGR